MRDRTTSMDLVRELLETGYSGSATDLAECLDMRRTTVYAAAAGLVRLDLAVSTTRLNVKAKNNELVFAAPLEVVRRAGIVQRAIALQPPIALVWRAVAMVNEVEERAAA